LTKKSTIEWLARPRSDPHLLLLFSLLSLFSLFSLLLAVLFVLLFCCSAALLALE
jgi:hypothetical protein